jgi:hypothetical protein
MIVCGTQPVELPNGEVLRARIVVVCRLETEGHTYVQVAVHPDDVIAMQEA